MGRVPGSSRQRAGEIRIPPRLGPEPAGQAVRPARAGASRPWLRWAEPPVRGRLAPRADSGEDENTAGS